MAFNSSLCLTNRRIALRESDQSLDGAHQLHRCVLGALAYLTKTKKEVNTKIQVSQ